MKLRLLPSLTLGLAVWLASGLPASAATFNIGAGDVAGLKSAINTANTNGQNDTINLLAGSTYTLTTVDTSAGADGKTGLPVVGADGSTAHTLTINGNNATITRSGVAGTPLMRLFASNNAGGTLTINGVKFVGGNLQSGADGGVLRLIGVVVMTNCTVSNGYGYHGGGIYMSRSLTMTNCTIANNGYYDAGGAIYGSVSAFTSGAPHISLTNCTLYKNSGGMGDGIYLESDTAGTYAGRIDLVSCTLDRADLYLEPQINGAGAPPSVLNTANTLFEFTTISAPQNTIGGHATVNSQGFNLSRGPLSFYLNQPSDQTNVDPKLEAHGLTDNGGPTQTIALGAGSPAIDKGNSFSISTDQRGSARIYDNPSIPNTFDGADIGAFEAGADQGQTGTPSFIVNTMVDHDDGACTGNDCTLREAVAAATESMPGYIIPVTFGPSVTGTLTLTAGQLYFGSPVYIYGPGARVLAISANRQSRVMNFVSGVNKITGLTIRDGLVTAGTGGDAYGAGIYSIAHVEFDDCVFVHNNAVGGNALNSTSNPGGQGGGGAIYNSGTLDLVRCTIGGPDGGTSNGAAGGKGGDNPTVDDILHTGGVGGAGFGAAVFNDNTGRLTVINTTVAGNNATGGAGGAAWRGGRGGDSVAGIYNLGIMTVTASTFSLNYAAAGAGGRGEIGSDGAAGRADGGIRAEAGSTNTAVDTIIAGNTRTTGGAPDVAGTFTSNGYNLIGIGDHSTGFTHTGDQVGTTAAPLNALLGPFQNNGGPTNTMLPGSNSPTIDQGISSAETPTDQRGLMRIREMSSRTNAAGGDGSDIGAVELGASVPVLSIVSYKLHGSSGYFDLPIPATGATGIECRTGGAGLNHQLEITFPSAVTVGGLSLVSRDNLATGSISVSGSVCTLLLSNVANAQNLGITLNNVTSGSTQGNVTISLGVLLGDTNRSGGVSASDISQTKSQSGQTVNATNFLYDVTASGGTINAADIGIVKGQSGAQLPQTLERSQKL